MSMCNVPEICPCQTLQTLQYRTEIYFSYAGPTKWIFLSGGGANANAEV